MQALFYTGALLLFEVCGLLIFALFIRGSVLRLCVIPPYERIRSYAVPCSSEYEHFKEHVLNKCTVEVIATLINSFWYISKQDATLHSLLISGKLLYMFRVVFLPIIGGHTTVFTVCGTC